MAINSCIYCSSSGPFSKEHALSKGFGDFLGRETLQNRICAKCNGALKECEGQLLRTGAVGVCRYVCGLGYDDKKGATDIFVRKSHGIDSPQVTWRPPNFKYEVLLRPVLGDMTMVPLEQVIIRKKNGDYLAIAIPADVNDGEDLERYLHYRKRLRDYKPIQMIFPEPNADRARALMKGLSARFDVSPFHFWKMVGKSISGEGLVRTGKGTYRAVAKILFHYAIQEFPNLHGDEKEFEKVRQFIRNGRGRPTSLVRDRDSFFREFGEGFRPNEWRHVLVARQVRGHVLGYVQFFVGPHFAGPTFEVYLGENPKKVLLPDPVVGHEFIYRKEGIPDGYDGVMKRFPSTILKNDSIMKYQYSATD